MHFTSLLSVATFAAAAMAASVQVNFYSDTGCQNFIGSRFIDFDPSQGGTHHSGGPTRSRVRGFSNHPDASSPFTGNVVDGECIGTLSSVVAVLIV
ncbi:hypothetical protein NW765_006608 [Fusarium oxysporum]|uniref:Uncharacterized protein n=1 Tax=Fusarium oxysporum TaxID=5507 RepID=A0A8H5AE38_FUSOX|nr:hypothetical protein FOWG_11457 [Fusarium oxysporum f. sp. lycopersici MN25]KAF5263064.1 hypothetical protein FOXYS1_6185 [Fusarium oxysporum]KAJ4123584.1 hypothetical protein NW765_006608 [Fusarium oxysporum]KAJ4275431.1 hypothetical protein NW764_009908 [Fusarium oxysporum]